MTTQTARYQPIIARDQFEYDLIRAYVERMAASWPASQHPLNIKTTIDADSWRQDWDGTFTVTLSLATDKPQDGFDIRASFDELHDLKQVRVQAWVANDGGRAVTVWQTIGQPGVADQFNIAPAYSPYIEWPFVPNVPPLTAPE